MIYAVVGIALVLLIAVLLYVVAQGHKPKADPLCMSCKHLEYRRTSSGGHFTYFCGKYGKIVDPADYCQFYEKRNEESQ
jgi:hypothetical protein